MQISKLKVLTSFMHIFCYKNSLSVAALHFKIQDFIYFVMRCKIVFFKTNNSERNCEKVWKYIFKAWKYDVTEARINSVNFFKISVFGLFQNLSNAPRSLSYISVLKISDYSIRREIKTRNDFCPKISLRHDNFSFFLNFWRRKKLFVKRLSLNLTWQWGT